MKERVNGIEQATNAVPCSKRRRRRSNLERKLTLITRCATTRILYGLKGNRVESGHGGFVAKPGLFGREG